MLGVGVRVRVRVMIRVRVRWNIGTKRCNMDAKLLKPEFGLATQNEGYV